MAPEVATPDLLQRYWSNGRPAKGYHYTLLGEIDGTYPARSRDGLPALVIPVPAIGPTATGRRAAGCELAGHSSLRFAHAGRKWDQPAAVLICNNPEVVDVFAVLATDVVRRLGRKATWTAVLLIVEEWQALLAPRGRPSAEIELGLWGELWFISQSADVDRAIGGWRGPERDATDFFIAGIAAEVKTTKARRQHHVSLSQVESPVGVHEAWLVSLWLKVDPASKETVPFLVDEILRRASDAGEALRRIARGGFSPVDRHEYTIGFTMLSAPEWYAIADVPRVRVADTGVSHLRYRVSLDEDRCAKPVVAERLRRHFHE